MFALFNIKTKYELTPTWLEHAAFWSGVRRATIAPRSHAYCEKDPRPNDAYLLFSSKSTRTTWTLNGRSVGGIVVSIAAFQAVDPGSIPGQRKTFFMWYNKMEAKIRFKVN